MAALSFDILARDRASSTFKKVGKESDGLGSKLGKLGKGAALGLGAGLAVAGAAAFKFGKDSLAAFTEAEKSQQQLQFALSKFPKMADTNIAALNKLNSALASKTVFDDDAIATGQATLAQYNLTGKQVEKLTPVLLDYAAKTGKSLPDAAASIGKATMGQGKALKDVGLKLTDTKNAAKNYENTLAGLTGKVGGFAESQGKTAAGSIEILKNRFGEVQEAVGAKLAPALVKMTEIFSGKVLPAIEKVTSSKGFKDFFTKAGELVTAYAGKVKEFLPTVVALFKNLKDGVVSAFNSISSAVEKNKPQLEQLVNALIAVGKKIYEVLGPTFKTILAGVGTAIGIVITVVAALVTGFNAIKTPIVTVLQVVADVFLGFVGSLVNGAAKAFGWVPGLGGKLKTAADEFNEFKDNVNRSLANLQDRTIRIGIDTRGGSITASGRSSSGGARIGGVAGVRDMATGGLVKARPGGTIVRLAEAGEDELVVPMSRLGRKSSGGTNITVVINGPADPAGTARAVRDELVKLKRSGMNLGLA